MNHAGTSASDDGSMTLTGHLSELRKRLIRSVGALALGTLACSFFSDQIFEFVTASVGELYFSRPMDAFFVYLKLMICAGALLASPVLFYQLWAFLMPAFSGKERRRILSFSLLSALLFAAGCLIAFFLVIPRGLAFFLSFGSSSFKPLLTMEGYLDFVTALILPFGAVLDLPLVLVLLAKMGLVTSALLRRKRKTVIFLSFVAAAVFTATTDVVTQCLLALPAIALYEVSILFIAWVLKR